MNSSLLLARQTRRRLLRYSPVILVLSTFLLFCNYGETIAAGAPGFSSVPKQSTFALTNAVILVSPTALDFGSVPVGNSTTNTFLVENIGRGRLIGAASVPAPFEIISGSNYDLREKEIQVVTVAYTPRRVRTNTATVTFTGGGGAKTKVAASGRE